MPSDTFTIIANGRHGTTLFSKQQDVELHALHKGVFVEQEGGQKLEGITIACPRIAEPAANPAT